MFLTSHLLVISFFNYGFVSAGLLAVSIPIIIHLLNRRRFRTVTWAAMEFLLRAMKKNRKRLRFEQLLLLVTRCLLISLLGVALAQYAGCNNTSESATVQRPKLDIYIVDNSYSSAYRRDPADPNAPEIKTHLDKAKALVKMMIAGGSRSVIITTAKPASPVISEPETKADVAMVAVDRIEQSWNSADLKQALNLALEAAGKDKNNDFDKRLFIVSHSSRSEWDITDSNSFKQIGAQLARVFSQITPISLADEQKSQWNGAILDIQPTSHLVSTKFWVDFKADVRGYFPKTDPGHEASVEWTTDQPLLSGVHPLKLDGASNALPQTLSDVLFKAGGYHVLTVRLNDPADHLPIDNVRHRVIDVASELKVLIVEGPGSSDRFGGPAHFVETATNLTAGHYKAEKITPSELRQKALGDYVAMVLVNVPEISPEESDDLAAFVRQGGALIAFMGSAVKQNEYNSLLFERHSLLPGKLVSVMNYHREEYTLTFKPGVGGGTFTLGFNGTFSPPIHYSSDGKITAAKIQDALSRIRNMPAVTAIAGNDNLHYTITFTVNGSADALPQDEATADGGGLQGSKSLSISTGKVIDGSSFDFKPKSVNHPLLRAFSNHENTGLDHVQVTKYWQVDPDYLVNLVKGFRDTQARINGECDALTQNGADPQSLPAPLAAEQTKLVEQLTAFFQSYRDLGESPADPRDPLGKVPPALAQLSAADLTRKPFARDAREAVKVLLDRTIRKLEPGKPERVLNYLPLKANAPVDPAITAQTVGRGRVLFISTSGNEEWTDFPNNLSYPQLLFEMLDGSLRSRDAWMNLTVGDRLVVPPDVRAGAVVALTRNDVDQTKIPVFPPEREVKGAPAAVDANDSQDGAWPSLYHTDFLTQPGMYTLTLGNRKLPIAVNVPAINQADVTTVDNETISQALGGVKIEERVNFNNPDRDYYGWLTLIVVLALAGFECLIAWKFGHNRQLPGGAGPAVRTAPPPPSLPPVPMGGAGAVGGNMA